MVQSGRDTDELNADLARARKQVREQHEQNITLADAKRPERFAGAQFVGYVDPQSIKFDKFGTMSLTFRIPPEYRDNGLSFINAHGILLSVDAQRWNEVPVDEDDDG